LRIIIIIIIIVVIIIIIIVIIIISSIRLIKFITIKYCVFDGHRVAK
jgi:hypothetical protein